VAITIDRISLMTDGFTKALGWDDVIGLAAKDINIEIAASGVIASIPIGVEVTSKLPNGSSMAGTIKTAVKWDVQPSLVAAPTAGQTLFRLTKTIADAGAFMGQTGDKDMATIVRDGGTSDALFRSAVGWTTRGIATQATSVGPSTGNESGGVPDALTLLKAAGVEVLEVAVASGTSGGPSGSVRRLIRKPCRVVYYSGHGLTNGNCLGIQTGTVSYQCWATAPDLTATWTVPACNNFDYFVIAGCSLLRYRPAAGAAPGETIGLDWSKLLAAKGGPLLAMFGYADSAPSDKSAGDALASEFGKVIAGGKSGHDLVEEWLTFNGVRKAWNAVAMDAKGYWWIEPRRWLGMSESFDRLQDIKGPRAIP
jgi:hypothetical protein